MESAYHMIGLDSADFFRLESGRITQSQIVEKGEQLFSTILTSGALFSSSIQLLRLVTAYAVLPQLQQGRGHSRQFNLDHLVGDTNYVFFSVGKRYWHEQLEAANFGFLFDIEQLLLQQNAILRTRDLLADYEELLDEVVQRYVPHWREDEFSDAEKARLFASLDDTESTYTSPNDEYYTLLDAVEHQRRHVPLVQEATNDFLRRAHLLQQRFQCTGEKALQIVKEEARSGQYELLVKESLSLSLCVATIFQGVEVKR